MEKTVYNVIVNHYLDGDRARSKLFNNEQSAINWMKDLEKFYIEEFTEEIKNGEFEIEGYDEYFDNYEEYMFVTTFEYDESVLVVVDEVPETDRHPMDCPAAVYIYIDEEHVYD